MIKKLFSHSMLKRNPYKGLHYFFVAVVSSILITDFPDYFFFLVPISFTFLFLFLYKNNALVQFKMVWMFSFLYMLGVFLSILNLHPLTWAGITSTWGSMGIVTIAWFLISGVTATSFALPLFVACRVIFSSFPSYVRILFGASFFVLAEVFRTLAIWLLSYGEQSLLGLHYTYVSFGYTLTTLPTIKYIFSLGGLYAADFLFFVLNACFFFLLVKKKEKVFFIAYLCFFVLITLSNFSIRSVLQKYVQPDGFLQLAIIRTHGEALFRKGGGQEIKTNQVRELLQKMSPVDVVILPESTGFISLNSGDNEKASNLFINGKARYVLDSGRRYNNVSAFFYDVDTKDTLFSDKQLLMPQGEYMLSFVKVFTRLFGGDVWSRKFREIRGGDKGFITHTFPVTHDGSVFYINTHICFELFSPGIYMQKNEASNMLVNLSSLASFHDSSIVENQTLMMAKARALEQYKTLSVAANMSDSYGISEQGEVIAKTNNTVDILYLKAALFSKNTPYVTFGDYMLWFSFAVILVYVVCTNSFIYKKQ